VGSGADQTEGKPPSGSKLSETEKLAIKLRKERAATSVRAYLDQW